MPAPQKLENKKTTICITKQTKQLIRRYAILSKNRKGYESDSEILIRVLTKFGETNQPADIPKSTYHIDE